MTKTIQKTSLLEKIRNFICKVLDTVEDLGKKINKALEPVLMVGLYVYAGIAILALGYLVYILGSLYFHFILA